MIGYVRAYENMIETSASDWFNRLIAIRFMEINEYAPLETRLLSSAEEGKQDPDLYRIPLYQIWIFPIQNIIRLWNGRMRTGRRIKPHIRERTLFWEESSSPYDSIIRIKRFYVNHALKNSYILFMLSLSAFIHKFSSNFSDVTSIPYRQVF